MNRQRRNRLLPLLVAALALTGGACDDTLPPPTGPGPDDPVLPPVLGERIIVGRYDITKGYSTEEYLLTDSIPSMVAPGAGAPIYYNRANDLMILIDPMVSGFIVYSRLSGDSVVFGGGPGLNYIDPLSAAVSPDGRRAAYIFTNLDGMIKLRVVSLRTPGAAPEWETVLVNDPQFQPRYSQLAFSRDGNRLAWFQGLMQGSLRISNGLRVADLSRPPVKVDSMFIIGKPCFPVDFGDCAWSPTDPNKVAVVVSRPNDEQSVALFDVDSRRLAALSEPSHNDSEDAVGFDWAPDGESIVLTGNYSSGGPDAGYDLWTWDPNAATVDLLRQTPMIDEQTPRWSPDGTRLLYIAWDRSSSSGTLYVLDRRTSPPTTRKVAENVVSAFWK